MTFTKIAIVGMALRFPGANNIHEFWNILKSGQETIHSFTPQQLHDAGVAEQIIVDKRYKPYKGILDQIESFYTPPFEKNANDFELLSLQGKVMSHLTKDALASMQGGIKNIVKNTALFIGSTNKQQGVSVLRGTELQYIKENFYAKAIAPYLAYQFGFSGSAVDLYTACSSSAVATIQACRELISHQCDMAIAGGIAIDFPQEVGYFYTDDGLFSNDGHCRPFDYRASGAVFSNGAGVIVLKRLEDALANHDVIYSVILGCAINNDSHLKPGYLSPGIDGQYACLQSAWKDAGVHPNEIDYIEAHGTATQLGDSIEMYALKKAFKSLNATQSCGIGSVKSNIGHTTIASGMASLIKTSLMLQHQTIVPSINFQMLNPNIVLDDSPLYIATAYQPFFKKNKILIAGVSNFGLGGTNAHLVLQNYH